MRSTTEIWTGVTSLTVAELLRLHLFARSCIKSLERKALGRDARDLLDDAITATATGEEAWTEGVDLCSHLLSAVGRISSVWGEQEGEEYLESELVQSHGRSPFDEVVTNLDPERILQAREMLERIRTIFADDTLAPKIINLLGLGWSSDDVQNRLDILPKQYRAIMTRIRLTLQRELPEFDGVRSETSLIRVLSQAFSDVASV